MYNGAAAGFFCINDGFFAGVGGTALLVDVDVRAVAALPSVGGESSKIDDLCLFRSRAEAADRWAVE